MRPLGTLLAFSIAAVVALVLTWIGVAGGSGLATVSVGPWVTGPRHGTAEADPYARASYARLGTLPLGFADGLAFTAQRDSDGRALDGRCTIRILGRVPQARFWTIAVLGRDGGLIENPAGRHGFSSVEIVWNMEGTVEVVAAPRARPGNWLPTGNQARVTLVLRLYDTPVGFASRASDVPQLPAIRQEDCP